MSKVNWTDILLIEKKTNNKNIEYIKVQKQLKEGK